LLQAPAGGAAKAAIVRRGRRSCGSAAGRRGVAAAEIVVDHVADGTLRAIGSIAPR
jgi:hypothetical protein